MGSITGASEGDACTEDNVSFVLCSLVPEEATFFWGAGDNLSFPMLGHLT